MRLGSSFSMYGACKLGSNLSMIDSIICQSPLSFRYHCNLGKKVSVCGMTNFGSKVGNSADRLWNFVLAYSCF